MNKDKLLFKFELKKMLYQKSTKIMAVIILLFPIIIVIGIVSPSPQFSITMAEFGSPADFSNAMLGFLNSLGFYYIALVMLTSSCLSREIESKYIYFVLSAVPSCKRLLIYKILSISIVFGSMLFVSSIAAYIAYSTLYLQSLSVTLADVGILLWGILISLLVTVIYSIILTIITLITDGSIFASLITAVVTIAGMIVMSAIKGVMNFVPAWALDYMSDRNNIMLLIIYLVVMVCAFFVLSFYVDKKSM